MYAYEYLYFHFSLLTQLFLELIFDLGSIVPLFIIVSGIAL